MSDDAAILPSSDGHHDRMDLAMIRRAIREGWHIEPDWKRKLPQRMARIVADPASKNREAIGAFQALRMAEADRIDQMLKLYSLENPEPPQAAQGTTNNTVVNVGVLNAGTMQALAMDPARFDQFAALAESMQAHPAQAQHHNGTSNGATPNGNGHAGSNGTH